MKAEDRLVVAAAIERLVALDDANGENAKIIISTFFNMKKCGAMVIKEKGTKEGGSVEGMTEHGNISVQDKDEKINSVRGLNEERVGKWIVWRDVEVHWLFGRLFSFGKNQIWFCHFLSQDTNSERDRNYFLKYDNDLSPIAFGYIGDPELWFSLGKFSIYRETIVVQLGQTKMPRTLILTYSDKD